MQGHCLYIGITNIPFSQLLYIHNIIPYSRTHLQFPTWLHTQKMASRQTDKYGNRGHHTGHLGAPGTTGAVETHDPLGAPGSTGASPTTATGYDAGGQQEQLHRPSGGVSHVPLHGTGTTGQGYAYGTAASMSQAGHAGVAVPHTTGVTGEHATGTHKTSESDRTGAHGGGYDTGSLGGGTDVGHTGGIGIGQRGHEGGGYDTGGGRTHGQGVVGGQGGGYDTGEGRTQGQGLGGYEAGSDWASSQGVEEHGGSYDTGGGRTHGQDLGVGDWARSQGVKGHGGSYDTGGGDKIHGQGLEGHGGRYETMTGTGDQARGGVSAAVVEVVSEEPLQEKESKGILDKMMEHLPGTGSGGTK